MLFAFLGVLFALLDVNLGVLFVFLVDARFFVVGVNEITAFLTLDNPLVMDSTMDVVRLDRADVFFSDIDTSPCDVGIYFHYKSEII